MGLKYKIIREASVLEEGVITVAVIDGQGGGIGRKIIECIKKENLDVKLLALGTNSIATDNMLKGGADAGATGENAIVFNVSRAEVIMGVVAILASNSLMGELSPRMAQAIGESTALKILIPNDRCKIKIACNQELSLQQSIEDAVNILKDYIDKLSTKSSSSKFHLQDRILYAECYSGVSGDMTVAALIDLGADQKVLKEGLRGLNIDGYKIKIDKVIKNGIEACDFHVILNEEYAKGKYSFIKRNIYDIYNIIDKSSISENAKNISKRIFEIKANAEARAHGIPVENVYFHESGAVDSIIDIVGTAICLDNLKITNVVVSQIYDGQGLIKCRKGFIPVPVPAVINIAKEYNLNIKTTDVEGEMVTPTGAAIMAAIKTHDKLPESYKIVKTGIGAGKKDYNKTSGILRMYILET